MRLDHSDALARLIAHDHGAFCTLHAERGIDAVPCVYAVDAHGFVGIPIDRVKPKASVQLQRHRNLEADPRATLMVDQWDHDDWSRLWWVRAHLRWVPDHDATELAALLAGRYEQYADQPFADVLVLQIVGLTGWSAV